jgi:nuclease S1
MKRSSALLAIVLWLSAGGSDALAWGCDGHRAVVFIAERLLAPDSVAAARSLLTASPVDPGLRRFCEPFPGDPLVDDALWADDYRSVDPSTFGWHFINVPRAVTLSNANERAYCPGRNCVVDAIAAQYRALISSADPRVRANALRFLVHFIGDLHQPLHATTNGDRGGNCVPVTYYGRMPQESETTPQEFSPNLHGVWDSNTIRTFMSARGLRDAGALADYIVTHHRLPAAVGRQAATRAVATRWARDSHTAGEAVVYAKLPVRVGLEPASATTLSSCADNHDVVHRMLAKRIVIGSVYEDATIPVILAQLRIAGIRLAAALEAALRRNE